MKVHVVITIQEGILDDPMVFEDEGDADRYFETACKEGGVSPDNPYNDDYEVHRFHCEVL